MIILDTPTRSLEVKLAGAVSASQLPFLASYVDVTSSAYTPGSGNGQTNGAAAVTAVSAPAASTQRQVKLLTVQNADTASATLTLQYNDNGTTRVIAKVTLSANDTLAYTDGEGLRVIDGSGQVKQTGSGGGGGSTSPGGSGTQVQFNDGGSFGGDAGLTYDKAADTLTVGNLIDSGLTASRAVVTDSSKQLASSAATATEVGYLSGVTSALQTQLDGKAASSHTHDASAIVSGLLALARGGTNTDLSAGGALGDVLYADTSSTFARLAGNTTTTKKFLRQTGDGAASAIPAWDTVSKSDVGLGNVENTALSTWAGSTNLTTLGTVTTGTWSATAIGISKGGTGQTTASAAFDALSPMTTLGDVIYGGTSGANTRLAGNTTSTRKFLRQTGNGSVSAAPAWDTLTAGDIPDLSGTYQLLDGTLTALASYNTNGIVVQTAADTFAGRSLTAPAAGLTISNGNGVSGNPTFALANDLSALEGLGSTGIAVRTGTDAWAQRTITAGGGIAVSNGDGVAGNPTVTATLAVTTKTGDYTITSADDLIRCDASGGAFTITLPTASTVTGRVFRIKKIDSSANYVTLSGTIDGGNQTLAVQYAVLTVVSNGTTYDILSA